MHIIALAGRKRSGKDTVGAALAEEGYTILKFADPLKEMLRLFFRMQGADEETIERMIEGDLKETPTAYLNGKTPRWAMQSLGTEWGRECIHQNLWVDTLLRRAALHEKVVVTDARFPNEVEAIKHAGGDVIRIEREGVDKSDSHPSETQIDTLPVDRVLRNAFPSAEALQDYAKKSLAA